MYKYFKENFFNDKIGRKFKIHNLNLDLFESVIAYIF